MIRGHLIFIKHMYIYIHEEHIMKSKQKKGVLKMSSLTPHYVVL